MAATELGTSGCSPARRISSVMSVSVSASVVDAKTPHSSIVSWGAPSGEWTVPAASGAVRSDLMLDTRFPMWDIAIAFLYWGPRTGAGPPRADPASHGSAPALLTMRGARRPHNTIARTADRHPRSAPAVTGRTAREPFDRLRT